MKSILLSFAMLFIVHLSFGQDISDIKISKSGKLTVLDSEGKYISAKYLGNKEKLAGFSSTIIVISSASGKVKVYNQEFKYIAGKYINKKQSVQNVSGTNIIIKSSTGKVTTYNKELKYISSRYE